MNSQTDGAVVAEAHISRIPENDRIIYVGPPPLPEGHVNHTPNGRPSTLEDDIEDARLAAKEKVNGVVQDDFPSILRNRRIEDQRAELARLEKELADSEQKLTDYESLTAEIHNENEFRVAAINKRNQIEKELRGLETELAKTNEGWLSRWNISKIRDIKFNIGLKNTSLNNAEVLVEESQTTYDRLKNRLDALGSKESILAGIEKARTALDNFKATAASTLNTASHLAQDADARKSFLRNVSNAVFSKKNAINMGISIAAGLAVTTALSPVGWGAFATMATTGFTKSLIVSFVQNAREQSSIVDGFKTTFTNGTGYYKKAFTAAALGVVVFDTLNDQNVLGAFKSVTNSTLSAFGGTVQTADITGGAPLPEIFRPDPEASKTAAGELIERMHGSSAATNVTEHPTTQPDIDKPEKITPYGEGHTKKVETETITVNKSVPGTFVDTAEPRLAEPVTEIAKTPADIRSPLELDSGVTPESTTEREIVVLEPAPAAPAVSSADTLTEADKAPVTSAPDQSETAAPVAPAQPVAPPADSAARVAGYSTRSVETGIEATPQPKTDFEKVTVKGVDIEAEKRTYVNELFDKGGTWEMSKLLLTETWGVENPTSQQIARLQATIHEMNGLNLKSAMRIADNTEMVIPSVSMKDEILGNVGKRFAKLQYK